MTAVIQLYGGPGAGKSTLASALFVEFKRRNTHTVELIGEFVKLWAWQGRHPRSFESGILYGAQLEREAVLYGKVDLAITDSPTDLRVVYERMYGCPEMAEHWNEIAAYDRVCASDLGVEFIPVYVPRVKEYDPRGRFEDEAKAREVDALIRIHLKDRGPLEHHGTVQSLANAIEESLL